MTEQIASLTFECVTMTVTLQEQEEQLQGEELECEELWQELVVDRSLGTQKALRVQGPSG